MAQYGPELPLLNTLGYAELRDHLQGKYAAQETEDKIVLHTRQFAKRQRTWFRANPHIHWLDSLSPELKQTANRYIQSFVTDMALKA